MSLTAVLVTVIVELILYVVGLSVENKWLRERVMSMANSPYGEQR